MRALFSTLGLLALVAAFAVGSLFSLRNYEDQTEAPARSIDPEGGTVARPQASAIYPLGRTVDAGDVSWTVTDARLGTELFSVTYPKTTREGTFVIIKFRVDNTSDESVTLTQQSVALVGPDGRRNEASADVNTRFNDPRRDVLFNERSLLDPGESVRGRVNFDLGVPFDISSPDEVTPGFLLQLADTDPTVEEERYVDLGL